MSLPHMYGISEYAVTMKMFFIEPSPSNSVHIAQLHTTYSRNMPKLWKIKGTMLKILS